MAKNYSVMTDDELRRLARENSAAWHNADSGERTRLHEENVTINSVLDSRTGSRSSYDAPSGRWSVTPGTTAAAETVSRLQSAATALQSGEKYTSPYRQQLSAAAERATNRRPFSYDYQSDPVYSAYRKQYVREGQRAAADTLGQYAAMTGGMLSTAAVTASQQAGNYYSARLADVAPALYQAAYQRYRDEESAARQDLNTLLQLDQKEYNRYLDEQNRRDSDRSFLYTVEQNEAAARRAQEEQSYRRSQSDRTEARDEVDAILAALGTPSDELVQDSGYSKDYVDALTDYYAARQEAASASSGSKSGSTAGKTAAPKAKDDPLGYLERYGATTEEDARYALRNQGLTDASAKYYAKRYVTGMNESDFNREGQAIAQYLSQGMDKQAENRASYIWDKLSYPQKQRMRTILDRYGVGLEIE